MLGATPQSTTSSPRFWWTTVAQLGGAYVASLLAMLIASDVAEGARGLAVTAAQCLTFAAVTAAVVRAVTVARPFTPPQQRTGWSLALVPAACVGLAPLLALAGVEVGLGLLWLGLLVCFVAITWLTARHGSSTAVIAAGLGWWLVCGAFAAWACVNSLLTPANAVDGGGFAESGNALALYLALFAFATLLALTAVLQVLVLAVKRARRTRRTA